MDMFNYRFRRRYKHDLSRLKTAVEYILASRPDVAVCTGDLTSTGQPGEFQRVLDILKPLHDSTIPLLYLPGNHDRYVNAAPCLAAVRAAVEYLSHGEYKLDDMPLVREHAGVEFAFVNNCRPSNLFCSWGFMKKSDSAFVEKWCGAPKVKPRILLSHYPMTEDHPLLRIRHRLFRQGRVVALMRSHDIDLVLCGHVHSPYLKVDADGRGECCAGSVTRNGSMVEIDVAPDGRSSFRRIEL